MAEPKARDRCADGPLGRPPRPPDRALRRLGLGQEHARRPPARRARASGSGVSVSATTRAPRPGEVPGVNYFFLTREEFEAGRDRGEFLEWAEVHGHLYGTPAGPVRGRPGRGDVRHPGDRRPGGAEGPRAGPRRPLDLRPRARAPRSLEARLRARGTDDEATIRRRLANARREIALADRYDHQIINDDLDRAVDELAAILTRHRLRRLNSRCSKN